MAGWPGQLSQGLFALQQCEKFCDTVMESSQQSQHALHSCVLASASPTFSCVEGEPPFLLKCEQISQQSIHVLIELLYTGTLRDGSVSQEVLREVWEGSESLCIPHVSSYVENLLRDARPLQLPVSGSQGSGGVDDAVVGGDDQSGQSESVVSVPSHSTHTSPAGPCTGVESIKEEAGSPVGESCSSYHGNDKADEMTTVLSEESVFKDDESDSFVKKDTESQFMESPVYIELFPKVEKGILAEKDFTQDVSEGDDVDGIPPEAGNPVGSGPSPEASHPVASNERKVAFIKQEYTESIAASPEVEADQRDRSLFMEIPPQLRDNGDSAESVMTTVKEESWPLYRPACNRQEEPDYSSTGEHKVREPGLCDTADRGHSACLGSDKQVTPPASGHSVSPESTSGLSGRSSGQKFDPRVIQFLKKKKKSGKQKKPTACVEKSPPRVVAEQKKVVKVEVKVEEPGSSISWSELRSYVKKEEKLVSGNTGSNAQYQCSICGLHKSGYENFLGHKLRHAGVVPFHCKHCGKGFYRKTDGQRHEQKAMCKSRCTYSVLHSNTKGALKTSKFISKEESFQKDGKKWYKCLICEKLMVGYETFLTHKFLHAGIKPFACNLCPQEFFRKTEWRKHITTSHIDYDPVLLASQADKLSSKLVNPDSSEVEGLEEMEYTDTISAEGSSQCRASEALSYDIGDKNRERLREALQVLEESSKEKLMENLTQAEAAAAARKGAIGEGVGSDPALYTCPFCPEAFHRKWDLNAHKRALHNTCTDVQASTQYTCQSCHKAYKSKAHFRKHFMRSSSCVMSEENKALLAEPKDTTSCDLCGNRYSSPFYLAIHKKSHQGRNHACKVCGQTFLLHSNMTVHMRRHLGQKHYSCGVCSKRFVRNCELVYHLRSHLEGEVIRCLVCRKEFKHKNSLHLHMKLHTKMKQYLCDLCGKAFTQKGNLKKHKKETHASQYNYECSECEKKFYTEGGLLTHRKTKHSSLRPFTCRICLKTFAVRIHLTRHMQTHTDQRPHSCPQCNKSFRLLVHLRRHLVAVHNVSRTDAMAMSFADSAEVQENVTLAEDPVNPETLQTEYVFVCQDDSVKQEDAGVLSLAGSLGGEEVRADEGGVAEAMSQQLVVLDKDGVPMELPPGFVVESKQVYSTEGAQVFYYTTA